MGNEIIAQELNVEVLPKDESELEIIAKEKTDFIFQHISELCSNLKEAKELNIDATRVKTDWGKKVVSFGIWGKSRVEKQADLNTRAIALQGEAIAQLADLVQASIQFAAASTMLNQLMIKELAKKTKKGFINVYGEVQQVDEDMKKYTKQIEYGLKSNKQSTQSTNRGLWIVLGVAMVAIVISAVAIVVVLNS